MLDRTEIDRGTRMPVIGVVGRNIKYTNRVVLEHPKSAMSEAFRALRTNLQYIKPGSEKKVVLITSSISGEGKTFTSLNLASILSLGDKRVVLMGVDLRSAFDFVVLDTPPVTLIADAFELMRYSDVNMYVVRQGVTLRSFVSLVEGMHQSKQIKNGCVVLNDYQANLAHQYGYVYYDDEPKDWDKPWIKRIFGGKR